MVTLNEDVVVITVPHDSPANFLARLQTGIIEMVKSLLSVGGLESELVLDADTKDGCIKALELVQATLMDPKMIEVAQEFAAKVMPTPKPPE
jgi:hypothetical protein